MNFSFLSQQTEYALFAPACERYTLDRVFSAPAMCAVGCRKALELAVKWVYAADQTMKMPYKDNLQSLIMNRPSVSPWIPIPGVSCLSSSSWVIWQYIQSGVCSPAMLLLP